jgi:hypothetical protein
VPALHDGLPPTTKVQVFFWAEVCGAVHARGREGMPDGQWPPDLGPDPHDLKQMAERGLLAKRRGVWRLRRDWYARLTTLKVRAVPTPALRRLERPAPDCPTYAELAAFECICRWLDARPRARSRLPFAGLAALGAENEEPTPELRAMRRLRLVRHTAGCEWALSAIWQERLRELHRGVARALRKIGPAEVEAGVPSPVSLCAGIDTWGLNWVIEAKALPARLRAELDDAQAEAQATEREVETNWAFDGVPLRIYQAGVRAKGGGSGVEGTCAQSKGVSWSYILVNPSLRLLVRRTPLGGIAASARLGSACLWRRTPLAALNELNALIRRMWGREKGRWQVSYAHLAHDVADAPLDIEQLERYVSRSRRRALFDAAQVEAERLRRRVRVVGRGREDRDEYLHDDDVDWDALPMVDWEPEFAEDEELLAADPFAEECYEWGAPDGWGRTARVNKEVAAALEEPVERRALAVHRWGQRLSGVAFSQGGPVSFVMYRKDWEGRLKGNRHMEPLWEAAGWDGQAPVTRHEARLTREPIRELRLVGGGTGVERATSSLDDPWEFLACQAEVWGAIVGRAEACPGAVDVAWIRRVVPREGESNRSRWDTDPWWRVVQRAPFDPSASTATAARRLIRRRQRLHDVHKVDQQLLGLLKTREAMLHADPTGRDLSLAVRDALRALEREVMRRGEEFGHAAWVRRRDRHLPVGVRWAVLPFRPRICPSERDAERARVRDLETALNGMPGWSEGERTTSTIGSAAPAGHPPDRGPDAGPGSEDDGGQDGIRRRAWLRWRSAETRMRAAFAALEEAEATGGSSRLLGRLAVAFERASEAFATSDGILHRLRGMGGSDV